jgi:hypothetical protein
MKNNTGNSQSEALPNLATYFQKAPSLANIYGLYIISIRQRGTRLSLQVWIMLYCDCVEKAKNISITEVIYFMLSYSFFSIKKRVPSHVSSFSFYLW